MPSSKIVFRKGFMRRVSGGKYVRVKSTVVNLVVSEGQNDSPKAQRCTECGARIRATKMNSGKIVYFEASKGLRNVKHHCKNIGEHLSKKRESEISDLFQETDSNSESKQL